MTTPRQKNSFFLEKKPNPARSENAERNIRALALFTISAGYGLLVLWILYFKVSGQQGLTAMAIYLYGALGGYGLIKLKQGYTAADRSRRILTEVLEKSGEARIVVNARGETVYANARFKKMLDGASDTNFMAFVKMFGNTTDILKELDMLRGKAALSGLATSEVHVDIKGYSSWLQITCQYIDGWPGYVHWRFDDITHRYLMENAMREEREKLRDFTDNAPVGFFSVDADGRFLFINSIMLKLLHTEKENVVGRARLHDFLVTPPKNAAPYDCFDGGGEHRHGDIMMKTADGKKFKAAVTHSITYDTDGRATARSIVYDLTAEHEMQQALRESEDRFHRLFEEAPVGICLLSQDGIISNANQTLGAMLHLSAETLTGRPLVHFIQKDGQNRAAIWLKQIAAGETAEANTELVLKGTSEIVVQIYARKLRTGDSFVLHFIDLTDQKNLEKQFSQSQKMQAVGQLAGGVAHDFNNLLTAMIGFCDLLLLRHKPGDPSFADIMQIKQNANRAANLVRQLLAFSRQQTLQPRVLDITDVLTELSHLMRRLIGTNIELRLSHSSDLGLIRADQGQIEQVLINLAVNARDAMPQGGKLLIRTHNVINGEPRPLANDDMLPPGKWAAVEVEDNGTGISPDILGRIFEPFFSTKEVGAGTGLGLATVHGIVHQTGGHIDVRSTPGQGTTFTIFLPHHLETGEEKRVVVVEEKLMTADLTGSSKILLVEDEDAVRTFSARALSNKGYQVMDAPGAASALEILEQKKFEPEVLITDVVMPEMDGTALARIVREKYPHIKIIFISGYAEDKFKEHLGEDVWFLPKPFTLKQLATKVKEVIGEKDA